MANNVINRVWNQNRMVTIEDLKGMAFQAESGGHTFQISGVDDAGNVIAMSGSVAGVFLRPDNTDVAITGSASGGVVSVTLPANCYDVPGRFGLTIFVTSNGQKTAVYAAMGTVSRTSSGTVSPGTTADVVDLINQINAAVATIPASWTGLMADIAPTYSDAAVYPVGSYVYYNGDLYRCITAITTAESWTAGHWTQAVLGDDIRDLNLATNSIYNGFGMAYKNFASIPDIKAYDKNLISAGQYLKSDGTIGVQDGWNITALMPIVDSAKYYAYGISSSSTVKSAYFDKDGVFISGSAFTVSNSNQWKTLQDVPSNAVYVRFSISSNILDTFEYNFQIKITTYPQSIAGGKVVKTIKDKLIYGEYYSDDGGIGRSTNWYRSALIPVNTGDYIETENAFSQWLTLFNAQQSFEGTVIATNATTYTVASGIAYVGLNVLASNINTFICKVNGIELDKKYSFDWLFTGKSIWEKKTYISHGDSITWQDGKAYIQGEHIGEIARGYQTVFSDAVGLASYNNQGKSGWSMAVVNGNGVVNTVLAVSDYSIYDLCTIACGTNDFKLNVPLGTLGVIGDKTFDDTTFYGAYRKAVEYILTSSPTIRIVLMTPLQRDNSGYDVNYINSAGHKLIDYVNAVKDVGDMYGLPVCDMYGNSGFTKKTLSTYTMDGLHPNDIGYERMGGYLTGFLNAVGN